MNKTRSSGKRTKRFTGPFPAKELGANEFELRLLGLPFVSSDGEHIWRIQEKRTPCKTV
jgi:hypothetical protein